MSRTFIQTISFVAALAALAISQTSAFAQLQEKPNPKATGLVPPTLTTVDKYEHQIKLKVTGSKLTGAPAGFTIDWMPWDDFVANGNKWYGDNDYYRAILTGDEGGVGGTSNYDLGKGESTFLVIGESLFDDPGASTYDYYMLYYRTKYVFRARANATADKPESGWSGNFMTTTLPCGSECITKTQGYWKTHYPDDWPQDVLNNGLMLGNVHYTAQELEDIFNTPAAGNGLISLAHQLIAAKLNITAFGLPSDPNAAARILDTIADADALIGDLVVPPIGSGFLPPSETSALNDELTVYNEKYDCG